MIRQFKKARLMVELNRFAMIYSIIPHMYWLRFSIFRNNNRISGKYDFHQRDFLMDGFWRGGRPRGNFTYAPSALRKVLSEPVSTFP